MSSKNFGHGLFSEIEIAEIRAEVQIAKEEFEKAIPLPAKTHLDRNGRWS